MLCVASSHVLLQSAAVTCTLCASYATPMPCAVSIPCQHILIVFIVLGMTISRRQLQAFLFKRIKVCRRYPSSSSCPKAQNSREDLLLVICKDTVLFVLGYSHLHSLQISSWNDFAELFLWHVSQT